MHSGRDTAHHSRRTARKAARISGAGSRRGGNFEAEIVAIDAQEHFHEGSTTCEGCRGADGCPRTTSSGITGVASFPSFSRSGWR